MATKKTTIKAAVEAAAAEQPTDRDPSADVQADPALAVDINTGGELAPPAEAGDAVADGTAATDGEQPASNTTEQAQSDVELVAMRRDAPLHEDGPTTADVHTDEVAAWLTFGWEIAGDAENQS